MLGIFEIVTSNCFDSLKTLNNLGEDSELSQITVTDGGVLVGCLNDNGVVVNGCRGDVNLEEADGIVQSDNASVHTPSSFEPLLHNDTSRKLESESVVLGNCLVVKTGDRTISNVLILVKGLVNLFLRVLLKLVSSLLWMIG